MTAHELPMSVKGLRETARAIWNRITGAIGVLNRPKQPEARADVARQQREALERVAAYETIFNERVADLARRLESGDLPVRGFRAEMVTEIRFMVMTGVIAAVGGWGNLTPEDVARADERVREQVRYLDNWIAQLERADTISAVQVANRAALYAGVGRAVMQETFDKSVMRDFPDLPFYPRDGSTLCMTRCYCGWVWENVDYNAGNADVYWRMDVLSGREHEHCETCLRRAAAFRPLKIRGFQFVNLPADLSFYRRD